MHQTNQACNLVIDTVAPRAKEQPNLALREIEDEFFKHGQGGVARINTEYDFVIGIILAAEAGVVFVGFHVQSANGFQAADERREISIRRIFFFG